MSSADSKQKILNVVHQLWNRYPDLRFMQLVDLIIHIAHKHHDIEMDAMFFVEDDNLKKILMTVVSEPKEKHT